MKITAGIPTKKVQGDGWYTFEREMMTVDVVRIFREKCDRTRERYYYTAEIRPPRELHPDAARIVVFDGLMRVNVNRKLNPKWKPPVFEEGRFAVQVS